MSISHFATKPAQGGALDQTGRRFLITGANSGVGFETAAALAAQGAEVVLACRNDEVSNRLGERSATEAAREITARHPGASVQRLSLDLASQRSVKAAAAEFRRRFDRLDVLINNAGVMWLPRSTTEDGFETQLAVNHLGHYTLTCLLLPLLLRSSSSRVVTVSSLAHTTAELDLTDMFYERRKYVTTKVYSQSKLANLLFARELGRRLSQCGAATLSVAAHPGLASTNLFSSAFPNAKRFGALFSAVTCMLAQSPAQAALPSLFAATRPNLQNGD